MTRRDRRRRDRNVQTRITPTITDIRAAGAQRERSLEGYKSVAIPGTRGGWRERQAAVPNDFLADWFPEGVVEKDFRRDLQKAARVLQDDDPALDKHHWLVGVIMLDDRFHYVMIPARQDESLEGNIPLSDLLMETTAYRTVQEAQQAATARLNALHVRHTAVEPHEWKRLGHAHERDLERLRTWYEVPPGHSLTVADVLRQHMEVKDWTIIPVRLMGRQLATMVPAPLEAVAQGRVEWMIDNGRVNLFDQDYMSPDDAVNAVRSTLTRLRPDVTIHEYPANLVGDEGPYVRSSSPSHAASRNLPKGWRSDAPLIRDTHKHFGPEAAKARQDLPLVYLGPIQDRLIESSEDLLLYVPDLRDRPWNDVVLDFGIMTVGTPIKLVNSDGTGEQVKSDVHVWSRLADLDIFRGRMKRCSPWFMDHDALDKVLQTVTLTSPLIIETVVHFLVDNRWSDPVLAVVSAEDWGANADIISWKQEQLDRTPDWYQKSVLRLSLAALLGMAYLRYSPAWLVMDKPPRPGKPMKPHHPKPWTREDLPTIRLIDPQKAPRPKSESLGGSHATPKPHGRAGGPFILMHPRFYGPRTVYERLEAPPFALPPFLQRVSYRTERFISGWSVRIVNDEERAHPRAFEYDGSRWYELAVKRGTRKEAWVGPEGEYEGMDGHFYKVLAHETLVGDAG